MSVAADSGKPSSPTDVHRRSWRFVAKKVIREFVFDGCADIAASLTFYALLALFPALTAAISIVSFLGRRDETVQSAVDFTRSVTSDETAEAVGQAIEGLAESSVAWVALVLGSLLTIWAVGRYVAALGRAMNKIYGVSEGRMLWKLKPIQLLISLAAIVLVAAAIAVLAVSGGVAQALGETWGLGETVLVVWKVLRWPLVAFIVIFILAFLYYFAPNVKPSRFRWMSLGAAVALGVLAIASALFALYVTNFADYDRVYGSLAGAMIFLLWLWIANMALLVGVEFDVEIERVRQLQADIPAETQVQLPLRDARRIAKNARLETKHKAEARRLRRHVD